MPTVPGSHREGIMRRTLATGCAAALLAAVGVAAVLADDAPKKADTRKGDLESLGSGSRSGGESGTTSNSPSRYQDYNDLVRGSEKIEGLFTLHRKEEHLYAEIKTHQ